MPPVPRGQRSSPCSSSRICDNLEHPIHFARCQHQCVSFHHITLLGILLGIQPNITLAGHLFFGIALYQCSTAFGTANQSSQPLMTDIFLNLVTSAITPIGALLGIIQLNMKTKVIRNWVDIYYALSTGSFIHLAFNLMLSHPNHTMDMKISHVLLSFVGFLVIAFLVPGTS